MNISNSVQTNMLSIENEYPNKQEKQDLVSGAVEEMEQVGESLDTKMILTLQEENKQLKNKVNELTAFLFRIAEGYEQDFFMDTFTSIQRQNIIREIRNRIAVTPEILDIVNKSKQMPQE